MAEAAEPIGAVCSRILLGPRRLFSRHPFVLSSGAQGKKGGKSSQGPFEKDPDGEQSGSNAGLLLMVAATVDAGVVIGKVVLPSPPKLMTQPRVRGFRGFRATSNLRFECPVLRVKKKSF